VAEAAGTTVADLALAFVLRHPQVDVVLSGAATTAQLAAHVAAVATTMDDPTAAALAPLAQSREVYWAIRGSLPWT
jgi:aryl-alcohol dehydrogenase-like predicted oxidoreductase